MNTLITATCRCRQPGFLLRVLISIPPTFAGILVARKTHNRRLCAHPGSDVVARDTRPTPKASIPPCATQTLNARRAGGGRDERCEDHHAGNRTGPRSPSFVLAQHVAHSAVIDGDLRRAQRVCIGDRTRVEHSAVGVSRWADTTARATCGSEGAPTRRRSRARALQRCSSRHGIRDFTRLWMRIDAAVAIRGGLPQAEAGQWASSPSTSLGRRRRFGGHEPVLVQVARDGAPRQIVR
jgi:hypothetical protein